MNPAAEVDAMRDYFAALLDHRRNYAAHMARVCRACARSDWSCPDDDEHHRQVIAANPEPEPPRAWVGEIESYTDYDDATLDAVLAELVSRLGVAR